VSSRKSVEYYLRNNERVSRSSLKWQHLLDGQRDAVTGCDIHQVKVYVGESVVGRGRGACGGGIPPRDALTFLFFPAHIFPSRCARRRSDGLILGVYAYALHGLGWPWRQLWRRGVVLYIPALSDVDLGAESADLFLGEFLAAVWAVGWLHT
jgi:hypothetical protein